MSDPYSSYYNFLTREVITPFYRKRLEKLEEMSLLRMIKSKNPYLLKAKNLQIVSDLIKSMVDSSISSSEETMFGNLLECFAIHVSENRDKGFKSDLKSVDLEFLRGDTYYIVGIKSGVVWGNRDQVEKMRDNFKLHRKALIATGKALKVECINGCMYGKDANPYKIDANDRERNYYKYAGQVFWEFLSGDSELYQKIIVPIGAEARQQDETFKALYNKKINEMTEDFITHFTTESMIDWNKLIESISKKLGSQTPNAI